MATGLAKGSTGSDCSGDIAKAIGIMFMSRTYAHMAHLKTPSYSAHKVLNKFYDDIVDLCDDLAEGSQGLYGKLDIPFINISGNVNDPIGALSGHLRQLESTMMNCDEDFIMSIFQEIQKLYRSTLYKLTELS